MLTKTTSRDIERAALVNKTARIARLTPKQVRRVIDGDSANELVLSIYMLFQEGNDRLTKNAEALAQLFEISKNRMSYETN